LPVYGFNPTRPGTAVITAITFAAVTLVLSAANPNRRKLIIYNATSKTLFVAFAPTATLALFTVAVPVNTSLDLDLNGYTGDVSGILAGAPSASNKVNVTEVV
jgi:hypothetical protein